MRIELPSSVQRVWLIGDPHLGRRFENGVPLHRRGEREARQWEKFKAELAIDCDVNIMVGDLFDHPQVSVSTVLEAAQAYLEASARHPERQFLVMAGNHDRSRQLGTVGAWEVLRELVRNRLDNLIIVDQPFDFSDIVLIPWQWGVAVAEQVQAVMDRRKPKSYHPELVVLHHDLEAFGGNTDYMVPAKLINEAWPKAAIVTGHWHLEGNYKVDGVDVVCTGSLEPFTHAEDPNGEIYVTLTVDELAARDPADFKDKAVRVLLRDGDELPVGLDCLQLTGKRITALEDDEPSVAQKLGAFDWQSILNEHLKDCEPYVREFIDERLQH